MARISQEEKDFLKQYDITEFDRPSIAADMAVFSVMGEQRKRQARDKENYRKLPKKKLKILLIKRGDYPFKGAWALPGGFGRRSEEIYETAKRELFEETQISEAYLKLIGVFGKEGRDPRGWIISHTFLALIDGEKYQVRGGSDAWDAVWFDVELVQENVSEKREKDLRRRSTVYRLKLAYEGEEEPVMLHAVIRKEDVIRHFHTETAYFVEEEKGLAFDHAKLIAYALLQLRSETESDGKIVFDLMPDYFTLTELQNVVEIILGRELLTANFRRKMAVYVEETDRMITGAGHRPAKLFQRKDLD